MYATHNLLSLGNPVSYMHYDYAQAGRQVALQWRVCHT